MNWWPSFYALPAAWLFFLIPPLVLFYFLKLRRPRLQVTSLVLWRKVINDNRVNSPFQRFRRNILLLLQLMLLILLILAAMQPFIRSSDEQAQRLPILVDVSASMAATDAAGKSRLDLVREKLRERVDNLMGDQQIAIVSFSNSARLVQGFTDNRAQLRRAIDELRVEDLPSNLDEGFRVAEALSQSSTFEQVLVYSDGVFPGRVNVALPFTVDYQQLDAASQNFGITTLSASRGAEGMWDVFIRIDASPGASSVGTLELLQDGTVVGVEDITMRGDATSRLSFSIASPQTTLIEARLKADDFDSLQSDNSAWLTLSPARDLLVYVEPRMEIYREVFSAIKGVQVYPDAGGGQSPSGYDLVVSDTLDAQAAQSDMIFIAGPAPTELQGLLGVDDKGTTVIDWRRLDPLLEYVQLDELVLIERPHVLDKQLPSDFESIGYEVLVEGTDGPLLLKRREGRRVTYFQLFDATRSTLPYRTAFPVMMANLANLALDHAGLSEAAGTRTGVLPALGATQGQKFTLRGPDGATHSYTAGHDGRLAGMVASRAGVYTLSGGSAPRTLAAGLLDASETRLESVPQIQFYETSVTASATRDEVSKPLWPWLAMLALVVLLVEWWFFQHRPGAWRASATRGRYAPIVVERGSR
jgi:hypothetical protein